jgi:hypothetical protein
LRLGDAVFQAFRLVVLIAVLTLLASLPSASQSNPRGDVPTLIIQSGGWGTATRAQNGKDTVFNGVNGASGLTVAGLREALRWGNVTVVSAGDIIVNANVRWSSGHTLTLSARRNVVINDGVTISNSGSGNFTLRADNGSKGIGSVATNGMIDFSASTGRVRILSRVCTRISD